MPNLQRVNLGPYVRKENGAIIRKPLRRPAPNRAAYNEARRQVFGPSMGEVLDTTARQVLAMQQPAVRRHVSAAAAPRLGERSFNRELHQAGPCAQQLAAPAAPTVQLMHNTTQNVFNTTNNHTHNYYPPPNPEPHQALAARVQALEHRSQEVQRVDPAIRNVVANVYCLAQTAR